MSPMMLVNLPRRAADHAATRASHVPPHGERFERRAMHWAAIAIVAALPAALLLIA